MKLHAWLGGLRHKTPRGATREGQICQRCGMARVAVWRSDGHGWRTVSVERAPGTGFVLREVGHCWGRKP